MFVAMNRFKVLSGSQTDFEQVWTTRDTHLREVPGFITFHLFRGPDGRIMSSIHRTRSGAAGPISRRGPGRKRSDERTATPVPTSRSILATPNSRGSR